MTPRNEPPVFSAREISKSFPGVRALQKVSIQLRPGRLLALLGENGAGKSTLMNILAGVFPPDEGVISLGDHALHFRSVRDAGAAGISAIFQELSLAPNLTVAENMFLGREPRSVYGTIDYREMNRAAGAQLRQLGLEVAADTAVAALRVGQQQVVEIARAVSTQAKLLIMDEPTSALSRNETESLLRLIRDLKQAGVAILYCTHKLEELAGIADDVVVMRDGRVVATGAYEDISPEEVVQFMAGEKATAASHRQESVPSALPLLRAEAITLPRKGGSGDYVVRNVDLEVHGGEIVGLFGLVGAGRTELLEAIFGAHGDGVGGKLFLQDRPLKLGSTAGAIAAGLALVPEDRKRDGLVLNMSSRENAGLARTAATARWGLLTPGREASVVRPVLERLRLKARSLDDPVRHLSGGNQQKVVLAKWLATAPKILLLDEPTRGIDVNAKSEIYALIRELAAGGLGILMVSSDTAEVLEISDRIAVMCEGRKTGDFRRGDATAENLVRAALPRSHAQTTNT
jgi:ABC-type sugar transport system ATPase subunit